MSKLLHESVGAIASAVTPGVHLIGALLRLVVGNVLLELRSLRLLGKLLLLLLLLLILRLIRGSPKVSSGNGWDSTWGVSRRGRTGDRGSPA